SSLTIAPLPDPVSIVADEFRIHELLRALWRNASRHGATERGVAVTLTEEGASCRIEVRDWGPGVPEAQLGSIFDPFQRAGAAGQAEGPGLGLHVCRRIAESHGGSIWAEAPQGGGLRVVVELPLRTARPA
ncbi:MAG: sensor histidine kinase, partial [Acidobacteriota bacterium]|nr:sensor histidine kinase [Acidobacteriota bacterium]